MFAIPNNGFQTCKLHMLGPVYNHRKSNPKKFSSYRGSFVSNSWESTSSMPISPPLNQNVAAIIFGDGSEPGLYPLTKRRSEGAIPMLADYRLIDVVVSNCINSNITQIYAITQFNSASLNSHLSRAYSAIGWGKGGFLQVLAAYQSPEEQSWFQGTADAVRRCLWVMEEHPATEFLLLPGHHLYRMDYQKLIEAHRNSNADITVAVSSNKDSQIPRTGFLKVNNKNQVIEYTEKPKWEPGNVNKGGSTRTSAGTCFASMGIYIIKRSVIIKLLTENFPKANHFGSEILSGAISMGMKVRSYVHDGYWDHMGSIGAFYQANIDSTKRAPSGFNFYDGDSVVYTLPRCLPPSILEDATITDSVIGDGCHFNRCEIKGSVIGTGTWIGDGAVIEDSVVFGSDTQQTPQFLKEKSGMEIPIGIGEQSHIRKAIIDKNARIGSNVKILNVDNVQEGGRETHGYVINGGIVIVLRSAVIPDGSML